MKVFFFLLISMISIAGSSVAQIQIAANHELVKKDLQPIPDSVISVFKKTKTIFFIPTSEFSYKEILEDIIRKDWTVTPIQADTFGSLPKYMKLGGYSFISLRTGPKHKDVPVARSLKDFEYITVDLWMTDQDQQTITLAKIFQERLIEPLNDQTGIQKEEFVLLRERYYDLGVPNLYSIFNLKKNLFYSIISEALQNYNGETVNYSSDIAEEAVLLSLAEDTLYIPETVDFAGESNRRMKMYYHHRDYISEKYKYHYRVISNQELENIRNTTNLPMKVVLDGSESYFNKFIIADFRNNKLIYRVDLGNLPLQYFDFAPLYKRIKKALKKQ